MGGGDGGEEGEAHGEDRGPGDEDRCAGGREGAEGRDAAKGREEKEGRHAPGEGVGVVGEIDFRALEIVGRGAGAEVDPGEAGLEAEVGADEVGVGAVGEVDGVKVFAVDFGETVGVVGAAEAQRGAFEGAEFQVGEAVEGEDGEDAEEADGEGAEGG